MKAFPKNIYDSTKPDGYHDGMDLRDYFAAKAMQGIITATVTIDERNYDEDGLAYLSYVIADVMMKARENK